MEQQVDWGPSDHGPDGAAKEAFREPCKPDYEKMIKTLKDRTQVIQDLADAIERYILAGDLARQRKHGLASLFGYLQIEIKEHKAAVQDWVKQQGEATDDPA